MAPISIQIAPAPLAEFQRLFDLEYGDRFELTVRILAISASAVLLYLYTGWLIGFAWLTVFALSHVVYFFYLTRVLARGAGTLLVAVAALVGTQGAYFWLPIALLAVDDPVLKIAGVAGYTTMLFFMLRRNDTSLIIIWGELLLVFAGLFAVAALLLTNFETTLEQVCVIFCLVMMAYYFAAAMFKARELRLAAEAIVQREAQEQKLASIGRLAGGVAHDFNNALTGISGNLELFFEIDDPHERETLLRNAQAASSRAATLVKQLLVFSRQSELSKERLDGAHLLEEAAAFQRRLLPASIQMHVDTAEDVAIIADKDLMVTALINLAVNAVDAMPDGGLLTLRLNLLRSQGPIACADGRDLSEGTYARFAVIDTGTGIPKDVIHRVLDPFFSTKPVGKGSGLGLSMVAGLAHSMDGGIQIDTGPGGTCVCVLLPTQEADQAEPASAAPRISCPILPHP